MTASELYQTDPEFQALIQCWIADKRCPIPMADYLRERGLEGQAEAAEWAAWELKEDDYGGFVRPRSTISQHWWCPEEKVEGLILNPYRPENGIPKEVTEEFIYHNTATVAILWFLDRWAEVVTQGVDLPKAKVGQLQCV